MAVAQVAQCMVTVELPFGQWAKVLEVKDGNHGHISLRPAYMEFEEFLFWMGTALLRRSNVTFPSRLEILHHFLGRNLRCVTNSQKLSAKQWMSSITLE